MLGVQQNLLALIVSPTIGLLTGSVLALCSTLFLLCIYSFHTFM